jgi:hypothetical protein
VLLGGAALGERHARPFFYESLRCHGMGIAGRREKLDD